MDGRQDGPAKGQAPGAETRIGDLSGSEWNHPHRGPDESTRCARQAKSLRPEPWQAAHHADPVGDSRSVKRDRAGSRSIDEETEDTRA